MSKKYDHRQRRIRVRAVRRGEPDLRKLARALLDLAVAQAEADAERQHLAHPPKVVELRPPTPPGPEKDAA